MVRSSAVFRGHQHCNIGSVLNRHRDNRETDTDTHRETQTQTHTHTHMHLATAAWAQHTSANKASAFTNECTCTARASTGGCHWPSVLCQETKAGRWEGGGAGTGPGVSREGIAYTLTCNDSASLSCLACKISAGKSPASEAEWKVKSNLQHTFKAKCHGVHQGQG